MFPADLLTSDPFMSHIRDRIDKCAELASLTYNALEFVETCAYATLLQWDDDIQHGDSGPYMHNIERISTALREIDSCMPPLHVTPYANETSNNTDLSRKLKALCESVRDVVPALLSLRIPAIDKLLSSEYDKLDRKIAELMVLQHKVLIIVPMVRKHFLRSPQYLVPVNEFVNDLDVRELIFVIGAYENRLLRFRVHHYAVHDEDENYPTL
jgi:hypothetical protein